MNSYIRVDKRDVVREYDAHIDERKRIIIKGAEHNTYRIKCLADGTVLLSPLLIIEENSIPEKTLKMIKESLANLEAGNVSEPMDLDKYSMDELDEEEKE